MSIKSLLNEPPASESSAQGGTEAGSDTMTPDEAWQALKAHPNARTANLAMLADVVARRTKCVGPRVELSPEAEERARSASDPLGSDKRTLRVETSGVRDALRLLDGDEAARDAKRRRLEQ